MVNTKNSRGGLKIAVLIKQIPKFEEMSMTADGCLVREGIALEMNAYCRRAVAQGITLARDNGGRCTAFTLGPAKDVLREAIACGADAGVLISDPAFAGSDTLATARALAAALAREGPFDLILNTAEDVLREAIACGADAGVLISRPCLRRFRHPGHRACPGGGAGPRGTFRPDPGGTQLGRCRNRPGPAGAGRVVGPAVRLRGAAVEA